MPVTLARLCYLISIFACLFLAACTSIQVNEDESLETTSNGLIAEFQEFNAPANENLRQNNRPDEKIDYRSPGTPNRVNKINPYYKGPQVQNNSAYQPPLKQHSDQSNSAQFQSLNTSPSVDNNVTPTTNRLTQKNNLRSGAFEPKGSPKSVELKNSLEEKRAQLLASANKLLEARANKSGSLRNARDLTPAIQSQSAASKPRNAGLVKQLPNSVARLVSRDLPAGDTPQGSGVIRNESNQNRVHQASFVRNLSPKKQASATVAPEVKLNAPTLHSESNGEDLTGSIALGFRTDSTKLNFSATVTNPPPGTSTLTLVVKNSEPAESKTVMSGNAANGIDLKEGMNTIRATLEWDENGTKKSVSSPNQFVILDTKGPEFHDAQIFDDGGGKILLVKFEDDDLPEDIALNSFALIRQNSNTSYVYSEKASISSKPQVEGNKFRVALPADIVGGMYELRIYDTDNGTGNDTVTPLADKLGNVLETVKPSQDTAGTYIGFRIQVFGDRQTGKHVEFPPFAPSTAQEIPEQGFNPGDFVQTRTARLYYFRDAHRVAQIINRNISSLNIAAVEQAQRRAENSRENADDLTDKRRHLEREAVRAAQQVRNAENTLDQTRRALQTVQKSEVRVKEIEIQIKEIQSQIADIETVEGQINTLQAELDTVNRTSLAKQQTVSAAKADLDSKDAIYRNKQLEFETNIGRGLAVTENQRQEVNNALFAKAKAEEVYSTEVNELNSLIASQQNLQLTLQQQYQQLEAMETPDSKESLQREVERLESEKELLDTVVTEFGNTKTLTTRLPELEKAVSDLRQSAIQVQESSLQAQAKEDRARENQFRLEVSAAKEDPDTYVAGDINSVDPITQCSLSVIGEGLIQIRGPIKGINKIRTLINQIDSPLGQVKIGINTIQINGEEIFKIERAVSRIEGYVDLSRFLTSQSLLLMRKAIQETAAQVAAQADQGMHYQVDRDRKYLYSFFGRDFIDELYAMDSEFLHSENKILSLHSMDTISLNRALFILALARNDVREQIMERFMQMVHCDMPKIEWDFRRASELTPHKSRRILPMFDKQRFEDHTLEGVTRKVQQRYHFRNLRGFFDVGHFDPNTMNPMQREFIRLAQIFKSQMIAEVELKQRVIERGLIEDRSFDDESMNRILRRINETRALPLTEKAYERLIDAESRVQDAANLAKEVIDKILSADPSLSKLEKLVKRSSYDSLVDKLLSEIPLNRSDKEFLVPVFDELNKLSRDFETATWLSKSQHQKIKGERSELESYVSSFRQKGTESAELGFQLDLVRQRIKDYRTLQNESNRFWRELLPLLRGFFVCTLDPSKDIVDVKILFNQLKKEVEKEGDTQDGIAMLNKIETVYDGRFQEQISEMQITRSEYLTNRTKAQIDHRKLLNFLIDEQEEKYIELVEGTRAHIATIDNYLKRLAIALEDDFKLQFYDPTWKLIRLTSGEYDVTLGQIERTTLLTNNRAFAKVSPQATMEFDLPKRKIAIVEALDGAKALAEDYGALLNDPTFLASFQMLGGAKQASVVKNLLPGLPSSTDQNILGHVPAQQQPSDSSLQALVPDPEIYKFETGTGFEIRPVIQPDGDSVVYDFNYMYTTNIREPIAADEKHIGRIKRHFIDTQVQTSSFELREISRYQLALKAARTAKGVPLLEDIPIAGALFKPAASDESAIQQNIILGSSTVYPTLFDLMGLRWAPQVVDLDHANLLDSEFVVRGRKTAIRDNVFEEASRRVDRFLQIERLNRDQHRPDLYHQQRQQSRYHPNGYSADEKIVDPTGRKFERRDRRPPEFQSPLYDLYRHRPVRPEGTEQIN